MICVTFKNFRYKDFQLNICINYQERRMTSFTQGGSLMSIQNDTILQDYCFYFNHHSNRIKFRYFCLQRKLMLFGWKIKQICYQQFIVIKSIVFVQSSFRIPLNHSEIVKIQLMAIIRFLARNFGRKKIVIQSSPRLIFFILRICKICQLVLLWKTAENYKLKHRSCHIGVMFNGN